MSRKLEALEHIYYGSQGYGETDKYYKYLKNYLQSIDNANPSEALEWLNRFKGIEISSLPFKSEDGAVEEVDLNEVRFVGSQLNNDFRKFVYIIENALLKSQEQLKENAYIEKIKTMMKQKDCALRYIESEDCFAVKTILSDSWYKLTPEFIENNVREEIKPLPLIEKNKQLKEENAELKKLLDVIKEYVMPLVNIDDECVWDNEGYQYLVPKKEDLILLTRYCYEQTRK